MIPFLESAAAMIPLTISDASAGSQADILPGLGFNCFRFLAGLEGKRHELLFSQPGFTDGTKRASHSGIPILFPFPSRIRNGQYTWNGRAYQLPDGDKLGNAIHGFALDRPWRVIRHSANSVTGQFQLSVDAPERLSLWPADGLIEVTYTVIGATLRSAIRIANPDTKPLPWGLGTHAYFRFPLGSTSRKGDCLAVAPAGETWVLENLIPTGERRPVTPQSDLRQGKSLDGLQLDDCLTGVMPRDGLVQTLVMDARAGLQISQVCPADFRELVVFTPPHGEAVCIEPYTCPPDAINLHGRGIECGWRTLAPGEEFSTQIEISLERIYV